MNNKKWYIRIWDEGEYIDLWSLNHFLFGFILAKITTIIKIDFLISLFTILTAATAWEIFEIKRHVRETDMNRIVDIFIGLFGFLIFFYYIDGSEFIDDVVFTFLFLIPAIILTAWGYIAYLMENGKNKH